MLNEMGLVLQHSTSKRMGADEPIDNLEQQNADNANGERPRRLRQPPLRFEYFGPGNPASVRSIIGEYAKQAYPLPALTYLPPIPTYPPQMTPHPPIIPPYTYHQYHLWHHLTYR